MIAQIRSRDYAAPYAESGYDILFIGITYDSKAPDKPHYCEIEEYMPQE